MGGSSFSEKGSGKNAEEAFRRLREQALYDYGHRGYTGTIAEKPSFVIIHAPNGVAPDAFLGAVEKFAFKGNTLGEEHSGVMKRAFSIYEDKWGAALCVPTGERNKNAVDEEYYFLFGGIASA